MLFIPTSKRSSVQILRDLRRGEFDVLVGINLLAGADLPEVSLVAISMPTRKVSPVGGFADPDIRAPPETSTARSSYGDRVTDSMRAAIATAPPARPAACIQRETWHHAAVDRSRSMR